jgi:hypothetical protein
MKRISKIEKMIDAKRAEIAATESLLQRQSIELEELREMRHGTRDRSTSRSERHLRVGRAYS